MQNNCTIRTGMNEAVVFRCNAAPAISMHIGSGQCQVNVVDVVEWFEAAEGSLSSVQTQGPRFEGQLASGDNGVYLQRLVLGMICLNCTLKSAGGGSPNCFDERPC